MKLLNIFKTTLLLLSSTTLLFLTSCGPNAEEIADETCDCYVSITNKRIFSIKEADKHIDSCLTVTELKYDLDNEKKLNKEFSLYESKMNNSIDIVNRAYEEKMEDAANKICECTEEITNKSFFTHNEIDQQVNNCYVKIYKNYGITNNKIIIRQLSNYVDTRMKSTMKIIEDSYREKVNSIASRISDVYTNETNKWWITERKANSINDSINELINEWYSVNNDHEMIQNALETEKVIDSRGEFIKKYQEQATSFLNSYKLLSYLGSIKKYNIKEGDSIHKKGRYLFKLYLPPDYKSRYKSQHGYVITKSKNDPIKIMKGGFNSYRIKGYENLSNFNSATYSYKIKTKLSFPVMLDWMIFYEGVNTERFDEYIDSEVLLIGDYNGWNDEYDYSNMGYSSLGYADGIIYLDFSNCEIIGHYDGLEITKGEIDPFDEYHKYLKAKVENTREIAQEENKTLQTNQPDEDNPSVSCDDFLKDYERFMEKYIRIIKKYQANPRDATIMTDYFTILSEATVWASYDQKCIEDPKFLTKYTEIQMKIASAVGESEISVNEKQKNNTNNNTDCKKFLKDYEEFMDDYIKILKKYKANPTDMTIMSDYTMILGKVDNWANYNKECENDPAFLRKYMEIQMKITTALIN